MLDSNQKSASGYRSGKWSAGRGKCISDNLVGEEELTVKQSICIVFMCVCVCATYARV